MGFPPYDLVLNSSFERRPLSALGVHLKAQVPTILYRLRNLLINLKCPIRHPEVRDPPLQQVQVSTATALS